MRAQCECHADLSVYTTTLGSRRNHLLMGLGIRMNTSASV